MAARDIHSLLKSAADQLKQQQQLKNTSDADDDEKLCSFPVRSHPKQAAMEERWQAWMQEFFGSSASAQQLQKLLDSRFHTLSCLFYPYGTSESRSFTLFKFIVWVFLVDDVLDDSRVLGQTHEPARLFCSHQIKVMFGSPCEAAQAAGLDDVTEDDRLTPSELSTVDKRIQTEQQLVIKLGAEWVEEMRVQGMPPKQYKRLQEAVVENLVGILEVVALREQGKLPASVAEYVALRRKDSGYKLVFIGCEFDLGIELDDKALSHPSLEALHDATSDQGCWINDLLSFHKEYHEGDFVNLPAVIHYLNNNNSPNDVDFHESLFEARAMIHARDQDCVRLSREVEEWNPALCPYVEATHCTISGLLAWTLTSLRYKVESDSASEPTLA